MNLNFFAKQKEQNPSNKSLGYDSQLVKVIAFASFVIVFSIILISTVVFMITEKEAVEKLKTKDLQYIAQSISAKIDGRIERAIETSKILANDPITTQWLKGMEDDDILKKAVFEKLHQIAYDYDYSNSFIVSNLTGHYWTEDGKLIDTMTKSDEDDSWFYDTISAKEPVSVQIDFNDERNDTFVFVNVLMGDVDNPLAITGVGLSLTNFSKEFQSFKYGAESNLWLIDESGMIYLSDNIQHNGKNIGAFINNKTKESVLNRFWDGTQNLEYKNADGEIVDLISYPLKSSKLKLIIEIPRLETISFLQKIKWNAIFAAAFFIIVIILLFYFISVKLANPYKRALKLNEQLEQKVEERTKELFEKNMKIMDSIYYAKRIQEAILPSKEKLENLFADFFLLWKPKDIVGGDFYWSKRLGNDDYIIAVGDCTGHGVPGALMSMLAISILNHIVDHDCKTDPGFILQKLNLFIKETLNQESSQGATDDGLDIGLCYIKKGQKAIFSGAKCSLYVAEDNRVSIYKGDKRSIGYRRTRKDFSYTNQEFKINDQQTFYLSTDGFFDQNGGPKNYSFGKKQFLLLIERFSHESLAEQKIIFKEEFMHFMGEESQRDDVTVLAFRP